MTNLFKKSGIFLALILGTMNFLPQTTKVQAQTMSCPEYVMHFEYKRHIKFCGTYFQAWETCTFKAGALCPCLPDESEPAC